MTTVFCPACWRRLGLAMSWEVAGIQAEHLQTCSTARIREQFDGITAGLRL